MIPKQLTAVLLRLPAHAAALAELQLRLVWQPSSTGIAGLLILPLII
jgi:hypothetical protein